MKIAAAKTESFETLSMPVPGSLEGLVKINILCDLTGREIAYMYMTLKLLEEYTHNHPIVPVLGCHVYLTDQDTVTFTEERP